MGQFVEDLERLVVAHHVLDVAGHEGVSDLVAVPNHVNFAQFIQPEIAQDVYLIALAQCLVCQWTKAGQMLAAKVI